MTDDIGSTGSEATSGVDLTAHIVSAYVSKNSIRPADLPELISSVAASLRSISAGDSSAQTADKPKPAVPIKKSVTPDYIISLEDGQKFKSLKRPLSTRYGMTPDEYRAKWGLPKDYPMTAPNYAAKRSELAKQIGLGRKAAAKAPAKRGRKKTA